MKIEKVLAEKAIDWSPHKHAFVNPYNGCPIGCPFCFWLSQPGWEGRIQVKENIPALLERELRGWPKDTFLYFGSVCDPFMEVEREYGLSRKCLELIKKYEVPLLITTSATNDVIRQDIALLKSMRQRVVVVVELSRIKLVEELNRGGVHMGIYNANALSEQGLEVMTTLSPILPGITDLKVVLESLRKEIPVYVDSLQCEKDSIQQKKVMAWIRKAYPQFEAQYKKIVCDQDRSEYDALLMKYQDNKRVQTFPFKL